MSAHDGGKPRPTCPKQFALDVGSADELTGILRGIIREQVEERHGRTVALKGHAAEGVAAARPYAEAGLGLQV
ncbi:DUF6448 family protein [Streptomyces chromofuscus]|uniref:DUF6448 family protein n=1 Tax=Streptomyces chromofuscus TaxID=42881 RepID=UPI001994DE14|nr:hypothetical protein GCM10010254_21340 [Streptomyces chromofuscus]